VQNCASHQIGKIVRDTANQGPTGSSTSTMVQSDIFRKNYRKKKQFVSFVGHHAYPSSSTAGRRPHVNIYYSMEAHILRRGWYLKIVFSVAIVEHAEYMILHVQLSITPNVSPLSYMTNFRLAAVHDEGSLIKSRLLFSHCLPRRVLDDKNWARDPISGCERSRLL
jgi:hypothetical protein